MEPLHSAVSSVPVKDVARRWWSQLLLDHTRQHEPEPQSEVNVTLGRAHEGRGPGVRPKATARARPWPSPSHRSREALAITAKVGLVRTAPDAIDHFFLSFFSFSSFLSLLSFLSVSVPSSLGALYRSLTDSCEASKSCSLIFSPSAST